MSAELRIGTSGWQYKHWRGVLYEAGIPQREWLQRYAQEFDTVEINNSFYRLPEKERFEDWRDAVDSGFVFAVKASRYLTHIKRLHDPEEPIDRLVSHSQGLDGRRGPILLQLPPNLQRNDGLLEESLYAFAHVQSSPALAVEFRHQSWLTREVFDILGRHNAALVLSNRDGKWLEPETYTADWAYIRLHAGSARYGGYGRVALHSLAGRIERLGDMRSLYIYFNNDGHGCAIRNARSLKRMLN